jgi:hypothetical protein
MTFRPDVGPATLATMDSNDSSPPSIDNLPYDVISAIFLQSFEKIRLPEWHLPEPWNLASVCSKWRQITLETPALWNNLAITFLFGFDDEDVRRQIEAAKLCLSRTGQSLISLHIHIEVEAGLGQVRDCLERHVGMSMEHVLRPYVSRLRQLSFRPLEEFRWFLDLEPGMVDALESVSITFRRHPTSNITVFTKARSLRAATVYKSYFWPVCDPHVFRFPWTQLTQLDFSYILPRFKETHEVLHQCRSLISLKIGIQPDEDCGQHMPDTFLPCLETLEVFAFSQGSYGMFLRPFILPYLKHLAVRTYQKGTLWSGVLSAQCLSHLEHVHFDGLEPPAAHAFLKDAPFIKEWTFYHIWSTDSFDDVVAAVACGDLVPALRVFKCDYEAVDAMLIPILEARGKFVDRSPSRHATIESVLIRTGYCVVGTEPSEEAIERIRQFLAKRRNRGVEVEMRPYIWSPTCSV